MVFSMAVSQSTSGDSFTISLLAAAVVAVIAGAAQLGVSIDFALRRNDRHRAVGVAPRSLHAGAEWRWVRLKIVPRPKRC